MASPAASPAPAALVPPERTIVAETTPTGEQPLARCAGTGTSATVKRQRGIVGMLQGTTADDNGEELGTYVNGRLKKVRSAPKTSVVVYTGAQSASVEQNQELTVYMGEHAAEDSRWVLILEVKDNNTKRYLCVRCGASFTGRPNRIVSHCLRISGEQVNICSRLPTVEQKDVLERLRGASSTALSKAVKSTAVGKTPSAAIGLSSTENKVAAVDEALAKFVCVHDLSWAAFDSRDPHWVAVVQAIQAAPTFKPAPRHVLSDHKAPVGSARPGGLHLAHQSTLRDRRVVTAAASDSGGALGTGGTMVSDGAKLSVVKKGMLNSALVTPVGVIFLQSTDATGKTKNASFLCDDYGSAIEKAGPFELIQRAKPNGEMVSKKRSAIVKITITDRGGGCANALKLLEEAWAMLADTCKGHGTDLLIEDFAKPFKKHLKEVHEVILFITDHDALYGIFSSYDGVRALAIPADTRFATEVICVHSTLRDKAHIIRLFGDPKYEEWYKGQTTTVGKTKARRMKALVNSDAFWHRNNVFHAIEEIPETSLRILDTDKPNLKDAAFAFYRMEQELKDPLTTKLASIEDWGEIDLSIDLPQSGHLGKLQSYILACVAKRKADFLSTPVLGAAAVNPIYSFSLDESKLWIVPGGDAAVRTCIAKLYWGDDELICLALDGWDRYAEKTGIYAVDSDCYSILQRKVDNPLGFYKHVHGSSTLTADKAYAQIAAWLVCGFANQGASERCNKYIADIYTKKRSALRIDKGVTMLDVKMQEIYSRAQQRQSDREQRSGKLLSVAEDLRGIYQSARTIALEKRNLQLQLSALHTEQQHEEESGDGERLITTTDALEVLGELPLVIPTGYQIVEGAPTTDSLDPFNSASDALIGSRIIHRFEGFGWCEGVLIEKNTNRTRKINGALINFIAKFDMDDVTTDLVLDWLEYDPSPSADYGSWVLLEKEGQPPPLALEP